LSTAESRRCNPWPAVFPFGRPGDFIFDRAGNGFKVAATLGGAAIDLIDIGNAGPHWAQQIEWAKQV
jgi:hypothetical protein